MKILFSALFFLGTNCVGLCQEWTAEDYETEANQVALWKSRLRLSKEMEPSERLAFMWMGLRTLGHRVQGMHSDEVGRTFDDIQQELLAIPGHARHFADELEELENLKEMDYSAHSTYSDKRACYIKDTFPHLPSPETLQVLGQYLFDERDAPQPPLPGQDWSDLPANCFLAVDALGRIGLRNPPVTKSFLFQDREILDADRTWWNEIKSGKCTFSFKGQKVEYRFKPDGTWETLAMTNPPDDSPRRAEAGVVRPGKRPVASKTETSKGLSGKSLSWVLAGTGLLIGAFWWAMRKSHKACK